MIRGEYWQCTENILITEIVRPVASARFDKRHEAGNSLPIELPRECGPLDQSAKKHVAPIDPHRQATVKRARTYLMYNDRDGRTNFETAVFAT